MLRPLMRQGIAQLEELFVASKSDQDVLAQLEEELQHRQTSRAIALLVKVKSAKNNGSATGLAIASAQEATSIRRTSNSQPDLWKKSAVEPESLGSISVHDPAVATISYMANPSSVVDVPSLRSTSPINSVDIASTMSVTAAYAELKATPSSTWKSIEHTRRQLVQQAHPNRMATLSADQRTQALEKVKRVNAAYAVVRQFRWKAL